MLRHRVFVCWTLVFALVAPVTGFKPPIHIQVTTAALADAMFKFDKLATQEILNANECTDHGPVLGSKEDVKDSPCVPVPMAGHLLNQLGALADSHLGWPDDHFDNEKLLGGGARLKALRMQIELMVQQKRYVEARKLLGAATHTLQDFYAHTNWVELGKKDIFGEIEEIQRLYVQNPPEAAGDLRLAAENEDVCEFTPAYSPTLGNIKNANPSKLLPKASTGGYVLTSGYFLNDAVQPLPHNVSKCIHGAAGRDGINKDTDSVAHGEYHLKARQLAFSHTRAFVNSILQKFSGNKEAIAGLTKGAGAATVVANQVNRTGYTVSRGDEFSFTASGVIRWGHTGGLLGGQALTTGPEGVDGRAYARTSMVPPPMPGHPVGALIGRIEPPCDPNHNQRQGTGVPCPASLVFIGAGSKVTMPISGELHLLVNDGFLANNAGEFKVEISLTKRAP